MRHHVRHDATEIADARGANLRDRVVDDLLEFVLGERRRHELLEDGQFLLFARRLLLAAAPAKGLRGLESALALALEHLQLLVIVERPLELLLGRAQAGQDQAQRVPPRLVARDHRLLELLLETHD